VHKVRIDFLSRESRRKRITTIRACDRCRAWPKGIIYLRIKSIKLGLLRKGRLRGSEWPSDVVSFLFVIHSPLLQSKKKGVILIGILNIQLPAKLVEVHQRSTNCLFLIDITCLQLWAVTFLGCWQALGLHFGRPSFISPEKELDGSSH
jgi:hypothetical protein